MSYNYNKYTFIWPQDIGRHRVEQQFVYHGTKKLRCGYTTGSCAAAAAGAAARMLLTQKTVRRTQLMTPKGVLLDLEVCDAEVYPDRARCAVVKDSGDDPDVTNGIKVYAEVSLAESGTEIDGGEGIGRVTKAGLDQPAGAAAINSVPRKMIAQAVKEAAELCEYGGGFRVVISIPGGEELAKKTFNPRMGIVGGISVIGTTGIVEPMSSRALIETIRTEANMRRAAGNSTLILTIGNYSEQYINERAPYMADRCVTCSNYIGDAIDIGITLGFERILIVGHIGKLVKLGSGIMNTHSSEADGRMETLIACAALSGADRETLTEVNGCVTTDAALDVIEKAGYLEGTLRELSRRVQKYLGARTKGEAEIAAVIFSYKNELLIKTEGADEIIRAVSEE